MSRHAIPSVASLKGTLRVPPDKSITHRAVLLSALAKGVSTIENPLEGADCLSSLQCVKDVGCRVERKPGFWTVEGIGPEGFRAKGRVLDCGNSGTTLRLLSGILAAHNVDVRLVGDESLSQRPMMRIAEPLRAMGATVELTHEKFAPVRVRGSTGLIPIYWKSAVASAQVKSCVLLAGLHTDGKTTFEEPTLSRDHTERMLEGCGVSLERQGSTVSIRGPASLEPQQWIVPGDMSSAAFFIVAALVVPGSDVTLESVNVNETRAGVLAVLEKAGVVIERGNERLVGGEPVADLRIRYQKITKPLMIDKAISPTLIDEVPILAVAATQAQGRSVFSGIEELRVKETDRLVALSKNLTAMGAHVEERKEGLVIEGPRCLQGATLPSYDDHRIAMAFAVAGLIAKGPTVIEAAECVSVSYPAFWQHLHSLSA